MSQATLDTPATSSNSTAAPSPKAAAPVSTGGPGKSGSMPINYANRRTPPRKQGINVRLVVFIAVVALPLLGVAGLLVRGLLSKGIIQHGDYAEVNLKALGNFPFDGANGTVADVPQRWRDLDGKKVELKGFMFDPRSAAGESNEFQFVYNVTKCCFSGPPQVQERVYCYSSVGMPIFDQMDFSRVVGILHVRVRRDRTGAIHSVFDLDVKRAEELEG